ncbi:phage antirepressor N-terminal domain-containing protein [Streptomyces sp. NPDC017966]|uniref:phage antirepressor N-terminal domain-containing protein n=1 Tax=Streptomyces sp. NPDC017966 TaxID=3365023 RepID=UPI00378B8321
MAPIALLPPPTPVTVPLSSGALQTVQYEGNPRIVFRPAVEGLGVGWSAQLQKLKNRSWFNRVDIDTVAEDGKVRSMVTVDVPTFLMWLAGVNETKVAPEVRPVLVAYQRETAQAIFGYWTTGKAERPKAEVRQLAPATRLTPTTFRQVYFSDVPEKRFFQHLYDHGYLLDQRNTRRDDSGALTKDGYRHGHPKAGKGDRFFMLPEGMWIDPKGRPRGRAVVRPDRIQELVEQLISEGLRHNPSITRAPGRLALTSSTSTEVIDGRVIEFRRGA